MSSTIKCNTHYLSKVIAETQQTIIVYCPQINLIISIFHALLDMSLNGG